MRVSNDSTWKGFLKFRETNSVAISWPWILAIPEYFSLSTFLLCKIKTNFCNATKPQTKLDCKVLFDAKTPSSFLKSNMADSLRIETFSIKQNTNHKRQFSVTRLQFRVAAISNFSKAFSSVQFSSFLFSQNVIQYKNTYRNCNVAREPRRNQKALEAWAH